MASSTLSAHPAYRRPLHDLRDGGNLSGFSIFDFSTFNPSCDHDFLCLKFKMVSPTQAKAGAVKPTELEVRIFLRAHKHVYSAADFSSSLRRCIKAHMSQDDLERLITMICTALQEKGFCQKVWSGESYFLLLKHKIF